MPTVAVVGCGSWGKNLIRVFDGLTGVGACCHTGTESNREWLRENYPRVPVTTEYDEVLADSAIDAVVIATPIETHYELAKRALVAGKHVFVEKPITSEAAAGRELVDLAAERDLVLFVGYVFLYHPVFTELAARTADDDVEYLNFEWHKTGSFSEDIVENLGSHDFAMANRLFGSSTESIEVCDEFRYHGGRNVVAITADFGGDRRCVIRLDRLAPTTRKTVRLATASEDLYAWEGETLWTFDCESQSFRETFVAEREPLSVECETFVDCIENGRTPETDGRFGVEITEQIEQLAASRGESNR